jgi:putative redox protein
MSAPEVTLEVEWEGGKRYRGRRPDGPALLLDGAREAAPGPVDAVLVALAACSAIDVVEILEKRRTPPTSLRIRVDASRADGTPRRLTSVRLTYRVATASEAHHVERAVALSLEKYCSVAASLAPDIPITAAVEVEQPAEARP